MQASPRARRLLVRIGMVAVPVAAFALLRPGPFLLTIRTPAALVRIAAIVAGLVVLSWLLRRVVANEWVRRVLVTAPACALLWLTIVPYFYGDKTAHRTLADAVAEHGGAIASPPPSTSATTSSTTTSAAPTTSTTGPAATTPTTGPVATTPSEPATTSTTTPPVATSSVPAEPVLLRTGMFEGVGHRASGRASLYRLADETVVIQLDDIDIQSGPDYDLYVVPGADREDRDGGVRIGDLRANKGSDNYVVPDGVAVDEELTVLVWCEAFSVPVAKATQVAAP